jgi:hypothetical protein
LIINIHLNYLFSLIITTFKTEFMFHWLRLIILLIQVVLFFIYSAHIQDKISKIYSSNCVFYDFSFFKSFNYLAFLLIKINHLFSLILELNISSLFFLCFWNLHKFPFHYLISVPFNTTIWLSPNSLLNVKSIFTWIFNNYCLPLKWFFLYWK